MTEKIKEQILAVRATGRTNMFDTNMVQVIADEMKFYELVVFIEEHKGDYAKFILTINSTIKMCDMIFRENESWME